MDLMEHLGSRPDAKRLLGPGFPGDAGDAPAGVGEALAAYAGGGDYATALAALAESRVLVPVVAVLGEVEHDEQGLAHDKTSDMATVLLTGADGRQALLAFTSMASLGAWKADARPVPVTLRAAAQAAVQDGASAIVVDLSGPVRFVIEEQDLTALAAGWQLAFVGESSAWVKPAEEPAEE